MLFLGRQQIKYYLNQLIDYINYFLCCSKIFDISHLVETRVVEHVFTPALEHRSITGNITVSSQHLETIASEGNIAPEQE